MQNLPKKLKYGFKNSAYLGLTIFFVAMGSGCASTHKTTTTETTATYPNEAASAGEQTTTTTVSTSSHQGNRGIVGGVVQEKKTTSTTSEARTEHPGVISSTFHAIGYIIALPFIIIGGLFRIIFGG